MKRNIYILALVLVLVLSLALTGCSKPCEHEWKDANCEDPKTCELCDETKGAPLGHTWKAATCNAAKTCEVCGKVDGDALGHAWVDATCEDPKTCSTCKIEEGEALGHKWEDATTEAPKTCSACQATEGDPIDTDDRFTTATCKFLFGSWSGEYVQTFEDAGLTSDIKLTFDITLTFNNDGTMKMVMGPDPATYKAEMKVYMTELMYVTFEAQNISRTEADAAILATYGKTMDEYVDEAVAELDADEQTVNQDMVYYVDGDTIYTGSKWAKEMEPMKYTLEGDVLTCIDENNDMTFVLTKDAA